MDLVVSFREVYFGKKLQVTGFQIGSRIILPRNLFFAIQGARNDGHDFLGQVAKRGASGAVVSKAYEGPDYGLTLLPVDDVAGFFAGACSGVSCFVPHSNQRKPRKGGQ
jgi:UDP-N-acetylmuramyl pentapeptide synthase